MIKKIKKTLTILLSYIFVVMMLPVNVMTQIVQASTNDVPDYSSVLENGYIDATLYKNKAFINKEYYSGFNYYEDGELVGSSDLPVYTSQGITREIYLEFRDRGVTPDHYFDLETNTAILEKDLIEKLKNNIKQNLGIDINIYSASVIRSLDNDKWYRISGGLTTNEYGTVVLEESIPHYCEKDGDIFIGVTSRDDNYEIHSISLDGKEEVIEAPQLNGKEVKSRGKTIYAYTNDTLEKYIFTNNELILQSTLKLNVYRKYGASTTIDRSGNFWYIAEEDNGVYVYKIQNDIPIKMYKVNESFIDSRLVIANDSNIAISTSSYMNGKHIVIQNKLNSWKQVDGKWYFYDENGNRATGWKYIDNAWYYLNDSGVMQTGWLNDNGTWYYLNNSGAMQTGWLNDNGTWYYLNDSGVMQTGWLNDNGAWYYLNNSGAMQTGWLNDNSTWYYMYDSGVMATNTVIDGWIIDDNGVANPQ